MAEAKVAMTRPVLINYGILALIYCVNNQFTFYVLSQTTPGMLALFKSSTPLLTAVLSYFLYDGKLSKLQWTAVILLTCGITITSWDDCANSLILEPAVFTVLIMSCSLTAFSSVRSDG
jgi:drug/metabolite transporter (DMT)-like permease